MVDTIPLTKDASGVYRVGDSRVTLDLVVRACNRGASAEGIVQDYPTLQFSGVFLVIGYHHKHGAGFSEYFARHARQAQVSPASHRDHWSPPGLHERILARRKRQ